jgi:hypothetical protein
VIDISDRNTLEAYLREKNIIRDGFPYALKYCQGGVSGTVVFVDTGEKPMIVKQALGRLKVKEDWFCDPSRMNNEQKSNEIYHRLVPLCAPEVYFYDEENCIYGREAAPAGSITWKEDLLGGLFDFMAAEQAMSSLVEVHNRCAGDRDLENVFGNKKIFYELRISPYIEYVVQKYPGLSSFAMPVVRELMESNLTLVHGDFSPKNIMINFRKIYILDYEVAHYGHPSFDVAFFANHFVLKGVKNKAWAEAYMGMLDFMLRIYFSKVRCISPAVMEKSVIKLLALLMIARVDGKSPVEYISSDEDKEQIRSIAFETIESRITSYRDFRDLALSHIRQNRGDP